MADSNKQSGNLVTGRGIALGGFASSQAGIVAEITVNKKTGKITGQPPLRAPRSHGLSVSPALIENQISGNLIMGPSRALFEEVAFSKSHVTSLDWVTYPILRFADHRR